MASSPDSIRGAHRECFGIFPSEARNDVSCGLKRGKRLLTPSSRALSTSSSGEPGARSARETARFSSLSVTSHSTDTPDFRSSIPGAKLTR